MSNFNKVVVLTTTFGVAALLLWFQKDSLLEQVDYLYVTADDQAPLRVLHRISKAIIIVEKEFAKFLKTKKGSNLDATAKKILAGVTSDIDYIFGELDQVRGGDYIKKRRKFLVERLKRVSDDVDHFLDQT
jgi:hypothetical protein